MIEARTLCARGGQWKPPCSATDGNNPQGVCDLIGNVREWTLDGYRFRVYGSQVEQGLPLRDPVVPFEEGMAGTLRGDFGPRLCAPTAGERATASAFAAPNLLRSRLIPDVLGKLDVFELDRVPVDAALGGVRSSERTRRAW